jgi:predicted ATPase
MHVYVQPITDYRNRKFCSVNIYSEFGYGKEPNVVHRGHKLKSGVNCQDTLKQKGRKQFLQIHQSKFKETAELKEHTKYTCQNRKLRTLKSASNHCAMFSLELLAQEPRHEIKYLHHVNQFTPLPLPCPALPRA